MSITALTLQGAVLSMLKEGNGLKKQMYSNNIPVSEEEDETEKTKVEEDDLISDHSYLYFQNAIFSKIVWPEKNIQVSSRIVSISTPPPEA